MLVCFFYRRRNQGLSRERRNSKRFTDITSDTTPTGDVVMFSADDHRQPTPPTPTDSIKRASVKKGIKRQDSKAAQDTEMQNLSLWM